MHQDIDRTPTTTCSLCDYTQNDEPPWRSRLMGEAAYDAGHALCRFCSEAWRDGYGPTGEGIRAASLRIRAGKEGEAPR